MILVKMAANTKIAVIVRSSKFLVACDSILFYALFCINNAGNL